MSVDEIVGKKFEEARAKLDAKKKEFYDKVRKTLEEKGKEVADKLAR